MSECSFCSTEQDLFVCEGCEEAYCLDRCFNEHIKLVRELNHHNQQMFVGYTPIACEAKAIPSLVAALIQARSQNSSSSSQV
jgi:hypothetical protein